MNALSNLSIINLCLLAVAGAAPVASNASNSSGCLQFPLWREYETSHNGSSLLQRRDTVEGALQFIGYRYLANYTIGGQSITAILDTGSANTWAYNANFKRSNGYDPALSPTRETTGEAFTQSYFDNSYGVTGTWFRDDFSLGGAKVESYPFGLVNYTDFDGFGEWSLLGFGPREAEQLGANSYPTFVERLVEKGTVARNIFSMYVTDQASSAELLIGGIDTEKFTGPLYTVPFDQTQAFGKAFWSVNFKLEGQSYTGGLIDTGNPTINLPQSVVDDLARRYGCWWSERYQEYEVIDLPQSDGLTFEIGGVSITVPVKDLFLPSYVANGHQVYMFAVRANIHWGNSPENLLGDPILRQLFWVVDVDNQQFGFAPVKYSSGSNVVAVSSSQVPNSQPAPDQSVGGTSYPGVSNSQRARNSQCQLVNAC